MSVYVVSGNVVGNRDGLGLLLIMRRAFWMIDSEMSLGRVSSFLDTDDWLSELGASDEVTPQAFPM